MILAEKKRCKYPCNQRPLSDRIAISYRKCNMPVWVWKSLFEKLGSLHWGNPAKLSGTSHIRASIHIRCESEPQMLDACWLDKCIQSCDSSREETLIAGICSGRPWQSSRFCKHHFAWCVCKLSFCGKNGRLFSRSLGHFIGGTQPSWAEPHTSVQVCISNVTQNLKC